VVVASPLTVDGDVVVVLVAGLVDFVFLVGESSSDIPVLFLVDSEGAVGLSMRGVGGIENVVGVDDLSRDDLFSSSSDVGVADGVS